MGNADVLVIGGGIIGCACALELAQRGLAVTLIDKGQIGHGCSYGNAGMLTPCHAFPLPMPGVLRQSVKWLMDPDSPLRIAPAASPQLLRWLMRFARSTRRRQALASLGALVELSRYSLDRYRRWDAESGGAFELVQKGLVVATRTEAGLHAAIEEMELVAPHGVRGRAVDAPALRQLEPALTGPDLRGGVYFPDEAQVEPLATVQYLLRRCEELGVKIVPCAEVFAFERNAASLRAAQTTRGPVHADHFVLATGAWSGHIARMLGLRVPMLSGKGYALVLEPLDPMPGILTLLLETKVAVTPRRDSVRLAGTLELVGLDDSITARRVQAILRGARGYLNLPEEPRVREIWRGLRPCLPDGVPIIGRPRGIDNLLLATGHQMLGLQTAPATAVLAADLLTGASPQFDPEPFRATRF